MTSLFKTITHSFINTLFYIWSFFKALFTFRPPPYYPTASRSSFLAAQQNDLEWGGDWRLHDTNWNPDQSSSQVMTEARLQHLRLKAVNTVMTEDAHQIGLLRESPAFSQKSEPANETPGSPRRVFYDISLGEISSPAKSYLTKSLSDPFSLSIYSGDTHPENARGSKPFASSTPAPKRANGRGHKRSALDTISNMSQIWGSRAIRDIPPLPMPPVALAKAPKHYVLHGDRNSVFSIIHPSGPTENQLADSSSTSSGASHTDSATGHGRRRSPSLRRVPAYVNLHMQKQQSIGSLSNISVANTTTSPLRIIKRKAIPGSPQLANQAQPSSPTPPPKPMFDPPVDPVVAQQDLGTVKAVFDGLRADNEGLDTREAMSRESYWTNATHGTSACGHDSIPDTSVSSSSDSNPNSPEPSVATGSGGEESENDSDEEEYGAEIPPRQDSPTMPYPSFSLSVPVPSTPNTSMREEELKKLKLDSPLSVLTFDSSKNSGGTNSSVEESPISTLQPSFPLTPLPSTDIAYLQKDTAGSSKARESAASTLDMQEILSSFEDLLSSMSPRYHGLLGQESSRDASNLSHVERSSLIYGYHAYAGVSEDCVAEWYDVLQLDNYA